MGPHDVEGATRGPAAGSEAHDDVGSLVFTQEDGQAPKVEVTSPDLRFSGALTLPGP